MELLQTEINIGCVLIVLEFGVVHYAERRRLNELLVAQGAASTPGGTALTPSGKRALLRPTSPSHLSESSCWCISMVPFAANLLTGAA